MNLSKQYDILLAIFAEMMKINIKTIPASIPRIHTIFYELSRKRKYKKIFDTFQFQERIGFYFSELLQIYLENMVNADLLSYRVEYNDKYVFNNKLFICYKNIPEGIITQKELALIRSITFEINHIINCKP